MKIESRDDEDSPTMLRTDKDFRRKPEPKSVPLYKTVTPNKRLPIHEMLKNKTENVKNIPERIIRISSSPSPQPRT